MRFIVYGAGAIGATIAGRLHLSGHDVLCIARGTHAQVIRESGLLLEDHDGPQRLHLPIATGPNDVRFEKDDLIILAMKTQGVPFALDQLAGIAPGSTRVACAQNGVESERLVLRRFEHVYGISVMCPTAFLQDGVVQAFGVPVPGILDVGRYPSGTDEVSEQLAGAFRASNFASRPCTEIMRFKYGKLLFNLTNAIEAVCGPSARNGPLAGIVRAEAIASLTTAGVSFDAAAAEARSKGVTAAALGNGTLTRPGGSSWQSLTRRTGNIETDYLNGEIVLLGRLTNTPTPANALLQRLSNEMATQRQAPGMIAERQVLERLGVAAALNA